MPEKEETYLKAAKKTIKKLQKEGGSLTLKDLDSMVAMGESGKSEANIGDVRQIRKILFSLARNNPEVMSLFLKELSKEK